MELFTEKLLLKDIDFSFSIKDLVKDVLGDPAVPYRKEGEIPFHRRYGVQEKVVTEGLEEGQIRHWISTVTIDTYGEVMLPKGAQLKHYKKNPMVLWGHNYLQPENIMGSNLQIEATDKGLMTLTQFVLSEEKAARVYRLYKSRHLRMWSVGFIPIKGMKPKEPKKDADLEKLYEWIPNPEEVQWIHQKWRLLEYSAVPVGANPDALTIAVKEAGGPDDLNVECQKFSAELLEKISGGKTIIDLGGLSKDDPKEKEREAEEAKKEKPEGEEEAECPFCDEEGNVLSLDDFDWESFQDIDPETFKKEYEEGEKIADEDVTKPLPNEHSCRLVDPVKFKKGSFRRYSRKAGNGKTYHVIAGRLKGKTTMTEQSFRYAKATWSASEARKHCKDHKGILFEPAKAVDLLENEDDYFKRIVANEGDPSLGPNDRILRISNEVFQSIITELKELRELNKTPVLLEHEKEDYLRMTPEMFESFKSEIAELKAMIEAKEGAELSRKNRQIVEDAVSAMEIAVEKLKALLEATEKPKEEEAEEEEEKGGKPNAVIELSGKEDEFKEKKEDGEVVLTVVDKKEDMVKKLDFGKVFKKALDEKKGKVK